MYLLGVAPAEEKALGLYTGGGGIDGYVGFSATAKFDFSPTQSGSISFGQYDFEGVVEHEFSEDMGRTSLLNFGGYYSPMDMFRYAAAGVRQLTTGGPSYFSIDGGNTDLDNWNNYQTGNMGDLGDWAPSAGNDSYRDNSPIGVFSPVSPTDKILMAALGWTVSSAPNAASVAASIPTMTVANAIASIDSGADVSVAISDQATNVAANLGSLEALALAGNLASIALTDAGVPAMTISYGELATDTLALSLIGGTYGLTVTGVSAVMADGVSAYGQVTRIDVSDTAANVGANIDALQFVAKEGRLGSVTLTDQGVPTLSVTSTQLAQDAQAISDISSPYTLSVAGASTGVVNFVLQQDSSGRGADGIALDYAGASTSGNSVVGFQNASFTSGFNAVVLDGARADYAIQVAANGVTTIKDIGAGDADFGQSVTVSGESYIVFNGADLAASTTNVSGSATYPNDIYFIESPADAQMAQFYAAVLQRVPDLTGLEYWLNQEAAGQPLTSIAQSFINTPSFASLIGGNPAGLTPTQYISDLYESILGRAADPGGLAYWVGQMNAGMTQAVALISFTDATAATSDINAYGGQDGWLIDPSVIGGYADQGEQMSAQSVLTNAASSNFYNLSLVDPSTVGSGVSANGVSLGSNSITLSAGAPSSTIYLSASFTQLTVANSGDTIHDGPGSDSITITGTGNYITVGSASSDALNLGGGSDNVVFAFSPATDTLAVSGTVNGAGAILLNGTTAPVQGSSLNFGTASSSSPIFITIGSIGGGSAADVVTAANKAYVVADVNGNAATGALGEHVMFIGTDSAGDTEIWAFRAPLSTVTVSGHSVQVPISGADVTGAHQVVAGDLTLIATLIGVPASSLTAAILG